MATLQTRCIKGAALVDAPRIKTTKDSWSGYSTCPANSVALGLSYINLLDGREHFFFYISEHADDKRGGPVSI